MDIFLSISGGVVVSMIVLTLASTIFFDMQVIKNKRRQTLHPHARLYRQRPLVSVLVAAPKQAEYLEQCLRSIVKNTYRNYEIIVVDTLGHNKLQRLTAKYNSPKHRVVRFKSRRSLARAAVAAQYKHARGKIVVKIDGLYTLDRLALTQIVTNFNQNQRVGTLFLNEQVAWSFRVASVIETYAGFARNMAKKSGAILGIGVSHNDLNIAERIGGNSRMLGYAAQAVIYTSKPASFFSLLGYHYTLLTHRLWYLLRRYKQVTARKPLARVWTWLVISLTIYIRLLFATSPLVLAYSLFLAITLHQPALFWWEIVAASAAVLLSTWTEPRLKLGGKILYSLLIPITYGAVGLYSIVHLFVTIKDITWAILWPFVWVRNRLY